MGLEIDSLSLYLVVDPSVCTGPKMADTVAAAVRHGVSFVQLRDKTASTDDLVQAALVLKNVLAETNVPLVINDNLEAAISTDVDGVHVGQSDVSVSTARQRLRANKIIGLSCETPEQVVAVDADIVDYIGLGTVFSTATKADHSPTIGLDGLAKLARLSCVPTVAIGGLKIDHVRGVFNAGCDGLAVVSAICGQADPGQAAQEFSSAIKQMKTMKS